MKELFQDKGTGDLSQPEVGGMMKSGAGGGEVRFLPQMIPADPAQPLEWLGGS